MKKANYWEGQSIKSKLSRRMINEKNKLLGKTMKKANYWVVSEGIIDVKFIDMIDGFRFPEIKLANGDICFKIC